MQKHTFRLFTSLILHRIIEIFQRFQEKIVTALFCPKNMSN